MDLHTFMSRYILIPIGKTYSGRKYLKAKKYQRLLEKTQYWGREALEELRNEQFRSLVAHCYENVTYYRRYMDEHGLKLHDFRTVEDINKLPILTKEILNSNQSSLTARNYHKNKIRYESTGGTSGVPTHFGRDKLKEYRTDANNWRFWKYAGYIPGMKLGLLWGNELELSRSTDLQMKLKLIMENTKMLNCFNLSRQRLKEFAEYLQQYQADIIRGYATSIYVYVQYCKENGNKLRHKPKSIILTSDKIYQQEKKEIAEFFECEVFEEYGCRELSVLAHECDAHQGLHLAEEVFIFEVFNSFSGKCRFEGKGEIVVTSLFNYAMPMLRYRLGDEVSISSKRCSCGRTLNRVSDIQGRINDFVVTKTGKFIHSIFFQTLFYSRKSISRYQVRQHEKGEIVIHMVRSRNFSEDEMGRLMFELKSRVKDDLIFSLNYVDEIEVSPSGKRRSVISDIASGYIPN